MISQQKKTKSYSIPNLPHPANGVLQPPYSFPLIWWWFPLRPHPNLSTSPSLGLAASHSHQTLHDSSHGFDVPAPGSPPLPGVSESSTPTLSHTTYCIFPSAQHALCSHPSLELHTSSSINLPNSSLNTASFCGLILNVQMHDS